MHHITQCMDKVAAVQIVEPVLIWVMGIGVVVEVMSGGVLHSVFITSILRGYQNMRNGEGQGTYTIFLLVVHEGSNGPPLIGTGPGLSMNADGSTANAEVVGGTRNGAEGRRHLIGAGDVGDNQSG